jgi:hypothetical protein
MRSTNKQYTTVAIWEDSRRKLRMLSALTDESITSIVDRLASEELKRIKGQGGQGEGIRHD